MRLDELKRLKELAGIGELTESNVATHTRFAVDDEGHFKIRIPKNTRLKDGTVITEISVLNDGVNSGFERGAFDYDRVEVSHTGPRYYDDTALEDSVNALLKKAGIDATVNYTESGSQETGYGQFDINDHDPDQWLQLDQQFADYYARVEQYIDHSAIDTHNNDVTVDADDEDDMENQAFKDKRTTDSMGKLFDESVDGMSRLKELAGTNKHIDDK